MTKAIVLLLAGMLALPAAVAQDDSDALQRSVAQLRNAIGTWNVVTDFIDADGNVAQSVDGQYEFSWVIEDQLIAGRSHLPELQQVAAILFYINKAEQQVEMLSVGGDGKLWVMSGPLGAETRYTQTFDTQDGDEAQLRFTRYNVSDDRFESRMEITTDGGESWQQGNHQVFTRASR